MPIRSPLRRIMASIGFVVEMVNLWVIAILLCHLVQGADSSCVPEFGKCVMTRDCCSEDGLTCVAGDWAVTTDSTCLSKRSEALEQLDKDQKQQLIRTFYTQKVPPEDRKTVEEADQIRRKYATSFPELVFKLERKYGIGVLKDDEPNDEL